MDKSVYFIYIKIPINYPDEDYYVDKRNLIGTTSLHNIYLYGYTDKEKYLMKFIETRRKDIFYYTKKKLSISMYEKLKRNKPLYHLVYNMFKVKEVMLYLEYLVFDGVKNGLNDIIYLYLRRMDEVNVSIFKSKYSKRLIDIGYYYPNKDEISYDIATNCQNEIVLYGILYKDLLNEEFYKLILNQL